MGNSESQVDIVVVGGGIGGLAAAAMLGRSGKRVLLLERSSSLGGRGATSVESGFHFNFGPHALYRGGHGMRVLRGLGIEPSGGVPGQSGGFGVLDGRMHTLPGGFISLLTSSLLGIGGKLELARLLSTLPRLDAAAFDRVSLADWLDGRVRDRVARQLVGALVRLSTYTNAPRLLSAGAALRQLQLALGENVLYLDGGWQTLVDGLARAARDGGAEIRCSARVESVSGDSGRWVVGTADGASIAAAAVVLAVPPSTAAAMCSDAATAALGAWSTTALPVRAACLDVGLSNLPRSRNLFALGVDAPLYFSVHSAVARLARPGATVLHVAKYLPVGEANDAVGDERELEGLLDLVQPGWREVLVERRFLPEMTVAYAVVGADAGGARPGPAVAGAHGLYLVGDWVGSRGMLVDASLASAEAAAQAIVAASDSQSRAAA